MVHGIRILTTDDEEASRTLGGYRACPVERRDDPPATRVISPGGRTWSGSQPRGLAYWEVLARLMNEEPVHERDRMLLAMLEHVGIGKGRPFAPDARQRGLLEEAATVGEAMARAICYEPRFEGATVYEGTDWRLALFLDASVGAGSMLRTISMPSLRLPSPSPALGHGM